MTPRLLPGARAWAGLATRLLAGGTLAAAGYMKLLASPEEFALALEGYKLLPNAFLSPLSAVLPWVEFLGGVYLAAGLSLSWTVSTALALHGAFILALGSALLRGLPLDGCGCFGGWSPPPAVMLGWDVLMAVGLYFSRRDKENILSVDRWASR